MDRLVVLRRWVQVAASTSWRRISGLSILDGTLGSLPPRESYSCIGIVADEIVPILDRTTLNAKFSQCVDMIESQLLDLSSHYPDHKAATFSLSAGPRLVDFDCLLNEHIISSTGSLQYHDFESSGHA